MGIPVLRMIAVYDFARVSFVFPDFQKLPCIAWYLLGFLWPIWPWRVESARDALKNWDPTSLPYRAGGDDL